MANNYPTIRPTLSHNYAGMGVLPPDVTFTRASQSGGYYDGKTVVKAEENLLLRSQEFDNAAWIKAKANTATNPVVTANYEAAPDGTITADRVQFAASGATSADVSTIYQITSAVSGDGTASIWVKSNSGAVTLRLQTTSSSSITISVTTDWTRFTRTVASSDRVYLFLRGDAATSADVSVWGAQLEQRSSVTAYTPTTTQPITNYIPKMLFAPANVPVFDHNPTTGEALGLSVWEARTNLLLRSQEFDNAYWIKSRITLDANQIIAPDGTLTCDKATETTETGAHSTTSTSATVTASSANTASIYAKYAGRFLQIAFGTGQVSGNPRVNFDLELGVLGTVGSGITASITPVGNGWYRCSATVTAATTSLGVIFANVTLSTSARVESYTGDGYSGIYIWGAQLEAGAFATPYIPTVASTVARSADVAVMTGANFSRWYRADEGTLVIDFKYFGLGTATQTLFDFNDNTTSNRLRVFFASNELKISSTVNGTTTVSAQNIINPLQANVDYRLAIAAKDGGSAWSHNGVAATDNTSRILGVYNRLTIGNGQPGNQNVSAGIKSIQYYPTRLTNDNLVAVTQ